MELFTKPESVYSKRKGPGPYKDSRLDVSDQFHLQGPRSKPDSRSAEGLQRITGRTTQGEMMGTKNILLVLAVLYLGYTFLPQPAKKTGPVAEALSSATAKDKQIISNLYAAIADVTKRDNGELIPTLADWRRFHKDSLELSVGKTNLVGKYPGLDTAIEAVFSKHLTLDNVATVSVIDEIVAACMEVSNSAH